MTIFRAVTLSVFFAWFSQGCIVSTPIEPEPNETNYPPRIEVDSITPSSNPIFVSRQQISDNETLTISVRLTDPNREEALYFAWLSSTGGLEINASVEPMSTDGSRAGVEYEPVEFSFDPCAEISGNSMSLDLVISDRPFQEVGPVPQRISVSPGGYIDIYTWSIEKMNGACSS